MPGEIRRVGVIGAGVMGMGIAAQVANAGVPVLLLDIPPREGGVRDAIAAGAVARALKTEPAPFMSTEAAKLVQTGNTEDDLAKLADCDWIVEAIVERLDVKHALYRRLQEVRRPGTAVSSNTSTIPLAVLIKDMDPAFARDFMITHFFNPPRYMRLLELVTGPATDPDLARMVGLFCDARLGKSVVACKDSPGFVANRLGVFWMAAAVGEAFDQGLTVEEADAILGRPFGIPKTGVFALLDLVGLDLMPHVNASLAGGLPTDDEFHTKNTDRPLLAKLVADGYTGRKGLGGFYRQTKAGGKRLRESVDLATGFFRPERAAELPELEAAGRDPRAMLDAGGKVGRYAWSVMGETLRYATKLVPEAVDTIADVDEAMRLGFNWKFGPFELIDRLGADWLIGRLTAAGHTIPPLLQLAAGRSFYRVQNGRRQFLGMDGEYHAVVRAPGVLMLADVKLAGKPVLKNGSASVWDVGDDVLCFEFTSKSNALDEAIMALLTETIGLVRANYRALVIYNEAGNFSLGANLGLVLFAANIAAWPMLDGLVAAGQNTLKALKYSPFPVVSAPAGMALGGGCEILLHSDAIVAHAETYAGLVEAGVGLVPGWGGCKEMLGRWSVEGGLPHGPMPAAARVFEMVSTAQTGKSAAQAREMMILRGSDRITMNRDRLLADAKAHALSLVPGYQPPTPREITLPGPAGKLAMTSVAEGYRKQGLATPHDLVVARELANLVSGGPADPLDLVSEQKLVDLERESFIRLLRTPATLARIEHTLETGKPLRN